MRRKFRAGTNPSRINVHTFAQPFPKIREKDPFRNSGFCQRTVAKNWRCFTTPLYDGQSCFSRPEQPFPPLLTSHSIEKSCSFDFQSRIQKRHLECKLISNFCFCHTTSNSLFDNLLQFTCCQKLGDLFFRF